MGTCTIYKSKNFGPKWSGTKELAAYFTSTSGTGLGTSPELIGASGRTHVLIDPISSQQTQTEEADTSDNILTMDKYKNISVYIVNSCDAEVITAQIWSCPPQPTVADRDAAAAAITTGVYQELVSGVGALDYGWTQEGSNITVAAGANDISKLTATGGMIAVAVTTNNAVESDDLIKVYVVGEYA
tara:strand:- start:3853 stop:4410 length:558 start_codon:yes stop_codon:yes gene_type:complete